MKFLSATFNRNILLFSEKSINTIQQQTQPAADFSLVENNQIQHKDRL